MTRVIAAALAFCIVFGMGYELVQGTSMPLSKPVADASTGTDGTNTTTN